jgi:hypothetical protein
VIGLSVRARGDWVATLRYISEYLMETMARWVPTSPEYEAKTLFGRHLWDLAQHADALGHRTADLRLGPHASRAPRGEYLALLEGVAGRDGSAQRIAGMYDAALVDLGRRYRQYLDSVDILLDEPTVRIAERAIVDVDRLLRERAEVLGARPDLAAPKDAATLAALGSITEFVDFRLDPALSR